MPNLFGNYNVEVCLPPVEFGMTGIGLADSAM